MDVLVLRPGALGDTLMLAPAARRIASTHRVLAVGREPGISFLDRAVARVYDIERSGWHRLFSGVLLDRGLPVGVAGAVIGFFSDPDGLVAENLRHCFPRTPVHMFQPFPEPGRSIHAAGHVAECFRAAGLPVDASEAVSSACREAVLAGGLTARRPWLVFHPGSGGKCKNHPVSLWRELALRVIGGWPAKVERCIWLLGPAESGDRALFEAVGRSTGGEVLFCPGPEELFGLFERCCLYAGQDSGITHLAAMTGAPCAALFRMSDPVQWRPLGPAVEIVQGLEGEALIEAAAAAALSLSARGES